MFNHIDYRSGRVTFIDDGSYLKEDLLQVEYSNGFILDAGWYNQEIGFIVHIIKDYDWENPVSKYSTRDKEEVIDLVLKSIIEIEKLCSR